MSHIFLIRTIFRILYSIQRSCFYALGGGGGGGGVVKTQRKQTNTSERPYFMLPMHFHSVVNYLTSAPTDDVDITAAL